MEAVARMLPLHALGSAISFSVAGGVVWRLPVASQFTKTMRGTYLRGLINYKAHYNVPRLAVGFHAAGPGAVSKAWQRGFASIPIP